MGKSEQILKIIHYLCSNKKNGVNEKKPLYNRLLDAEYN